jgi:hypothetical protein
MLGAGWTLRGHIQKSIPIYCTRTTFDEIAKVTLNPPSLLDLADPSVSQCFPYLADVGKATGGGDVPVRVIFTLALHHQHVSDIFV